MGQRVFAGCGRGDAGEAVVRGGRDVCNRLFQRVEGVGQGVRLVRGRGKGHRLVRSLPGEQGEAALAPADVSRVSGLATNGRTVEPPHEGELNATSRV